LVRLEEAKVKPVGVVARRLFVVRTASVAVAQRELHPPTETRAVRRKLFLVCGRRQPVWYESVRLHAARSDCRKTGRTANRAIDRLATCHTRGRAGKF